MANLASYPSTRDSGLPWLGQIPAHWSFEPLKIKFFFSKGKKAGDITIEYIADHVGKYPVYSGQTESNGVMGYIDSYEYDVNEVIFTTTVGAKVMTPDVLTGKFSLSQNCLIMKPKTDNISVRFVYYLLFPLFSYERGIIPSYMQPSLRVSDLNKYTLPFPPLAEQRTIAAFLDRQTAKIDALIAKEQSLLDLLAEKRLALICQTVTRGLNPAAKMKDSGVIWLGEVPEHWTVERNKLLFREIDDRSEYGDEELLTVSHLTGVTTRAEKNVNMFMAESLEGYKRCHPGDLAINTMWAWMGALGISRLNGIVSPSYNVYRLRNAGDFYPKYLDYLYRTPQHVMEITRYSKGVWSSRLRLYPDEFFMMSTPKPPYEEQKRIVEFIEKQTKVRDVLMTKVETAIERLREYRSALISAAVTGKIDVRSS